MSLEAAQEQQGGPREAGSRLYAELHISSKAGLMVGLGPLRSTAARKMQVSGLNRSERHKLKQQSIV